MRSIDSFYFGLKEPVKGCLEALRIIILKHDPGLSESIKYGMPFFSIHKKMLCYFWMDKKSGLPYIGFKEAKSLPFPWLDIGERSTISVMYIDPYADLPLKKIRQTLKAAIGILELKSGKTNGSAKTSRSAKPDKSAKTNNFVDTDSSIKTAKSPNAAISTTTVKSPKAAMPTTTAKSPKAAMSTKTVKASKPAVLTRTAKSTKAAMSAKTVKSTKAGMSAKVEKKAVVVQTDKFPTSHNSAKSAQA